MNSVHATRSVNLSTNEQPIDIHRDRHWFQGGCICYSVKVKQHFPRLLARWIIALLNLREIVVPDKFHSDTKYSFISFPLLILWFNVIEYLRFIPQAISISWCRYVNKKQRRQIANGCKLIYQILQFHFTFSYFSIIYASCAFLFWFLSFFCFILYFFRYFIISIILQLFYIIFPPFRFLYRLLSYSTFDFYHFSVSFFIFWSSSIIDSSFSSFLYYSLIPSFIQILCLPSTRSVLTIRESETRSG